MKGYKNSVKVSGKFRLKVLDKDGKVLSDTKWLKNTITNTGKAAMAGLVGNTGAVTAFTYLALGDSATASAATQTALQGTEFTTLGLSRSQATMSRVTTTQTNDTLQFSFTWTATGGTTIQEIGIFNASSVGVMLARQVTGAQVVINTNQVVVLYKVQFT